MYYHSGGAPRREPTVLDKVLLPVEKTVYVIGDNYIFVNNVNRQGVCLVHPTDHEFDDLYQLELLAEIKQRLDVTPPFPEGQVGIIGTSDVDKDLFFKYQKQIALVTSNLIGYFEVNNIPQEELIYPEGFYLVFKDFNQ